MGKATFDYSVEFDHRYDESKRFIDCYFNDSEIKGKKVLIAGCRTGYDAPDFLAKGAKYAAGIDISRSCIRKAEKKYPIKGKTKFAVGNIADLSDFKDSEFDVAFCIGTIFYLDNAGMAKALSEFLRVTKPKGIVLVSFQKNKGMITRAFTFAANAVPIWLYLPIIGLLSFFIMPFSKLLLGRRVSRAYIRNDVLLSLKGLHYGQPFNIKEKFRIKTAETEYSSEKTTATYKIKVPPDKNLDSIKF